MNIYRGVLVMLALAPWMAQAQTSTAASGAAAAPQAPEQSGQQSAAPGAAQGTRGGGHSGQGLRPQPAIIVDANALIREGQRANAMEETQNAPPPRRSAPARKKPGVHLSTSRPLPLSTEDAGKP